MMPGRANCFRGRFCFRLLLSVKILLFWITSINVTPAYSYPVILVIEDEDDEDNPRCLQFSIPEDDDAHAVLLALPDPNLLPDELSDKIESWYVEQIYQMTKMKSRLKVLPKGIAENPPQDISKATSELLKKSRGEQPPLKIFISVTDEDEETDHIYKMNYFQPRTFNHIRERHGADEESEDNYEGVKICFVHIGDEDENEAIHIVFDIVMVNEEVNDLDTPQEESLFDKNKHIAPLEHALDNSINSARQILKEMRYMEQREQRMRETADGINARVHYFSFISIAILFGVTFLQVGYLKRYFKKKKLM